VSFDSCLFFRLPEKEEEEKEKKEIKSHLPTCPVIQEHISQIKDKKRGK
jgi:hypothetical protein